MHNEYTNASTAKKLNKQYLVEIFKLCQIFLKIQQVILAMRFKSLLFMIKGHDQKTHIQK